MTTLAADGGTAREQLEQLREDDKAAIGWIERVGLRTPVGEHHRQLRKAEIVTMLLDQLGEPHSAVAVAASAADLKAVQAASQGA